MEICKHDFWNDYVCFCFRLYAMHGSNSSWLIFCEGHTAVDLFQMLELLNKYSPTEVTTAFSLCLSAIQCRSQNSRHKYTGCGNERWMGLTENHVSWCAQVLLPEGSLFQHVKYCFSKQHVLIYRIWSSHSGDCEEFCLLGYNAISCLAYSLTPEETCSSFILSRLHSVISQKVEFFANIIFLCECEVRTHKYG
jgi:hypothetical protein